MVKMQKIVLASASPYRKALLQRLHLPFEAISPDIDESPLPGESAENLVTRLAQRKAERIAEDRPDALIIGSDQAAVLGTAILGKPVTRGNAHKQLQLMRNQTVNFVTGLCVINAATRNCQTALIDYQVSFRDYTDAEIERYLDIDSPYDCAGSFKSEQMGVTLMRRMAGDDPTALIGLPLIKLAEMLRNENLQLP
jgi:MAF protein